MTTMVPWTLFDMLAVRAPLHVVVAKLRDMRRREVTR
jgi:hypothetical protein